MILGGSGNGKTTAVQRSLYQYPQHIVHTKYRGQPFPFHQIVWLRLEAPEKCSLQELVSTFFIEVDRVIGTNYFETHGGKGRLPPSVTVPKIPAIINAHGIGMIVFDELQNLRVDGSAGHLNILNFLMKVINVTNVPIVTIGTYQAAKVLCDQFRLLRRLTSGGALIWDRMAYGALWKVFVEVVWQYQCLKQITPYSDRLAARLYWETQGITAYAISVFQQVQRMAIHAGGDEVITETLLEAAAKKQTEAVRIVIRALREGKPSLCSVMDDVFMVDLDRFISTFATYSQGGAPVELPSVVQPSKPAAELIADLGVDAETLMPSTKTPKIASSGTTAANPAESNKQPSLGKETATVKRPRKRAGASPAQRDLVDAAERADCLRNPGADFGY